MTADGNADAQGVQNNLTMREVNAFGKTGCACRIKRGGLGIFIEIGKVKVGRRRSQKLFIFSVTDQIRLGQFGVVRKKNNLLHRFQLAPDGCQQRQKISVDKDDIGFGMIHRVFDLIGRKTPVYGEEQSAHHGNGKKAFQIAVRVVVEDGHGISPFCQPDF